jgi:DNA-binding SARP family transcriptional activator
VPAQTHRSLRQRAAERSSEDRAGRRAPVRVDVLGGFVLHRQGAARRQPPHAQRLLAFLALHRRPLHRSFVSGRLWPDLTQEHAFGCLRSTLWRIGDCAGLLEATRTDLALGPWVEVDATELETCAEAVLRRGGIGDAAQLRLLVRSAHLLPDWYDDWVVEERERLSELRVLALELAAEELIAARAYCDAALVAKAAVRADPLRESATRLLIRLHLATGNPGEAVRVYRSFTARLSHDLELGPSPQIVELVGGLT